MSDTLQVSVIFPCLNERDSVGECVRRTIGALGAAGMAHEVIVSDNGSTDGSAEIARRAGARVLDVAARGYGHAVAAGIDAARGEVVLVADSDGTYPVEDAPRFAERAAASDAIVLGSRFAGRIAPGAMPFLHRVVGSPATRLLLRILLGVRCSDPHSGMRAMRRSVFESVRPRVGGWEFTVEMLVNAARRGVPLEELPIAFGARTGTSKLRALPEGWSFFRFMILHSPTFLFVLPGLVSMALGLGVLAWLLGADRVVGSVTFGVNSVVVGALATILGFQVAALGACARVYMDARERPGRQRRFTLERGLAAGLVLLVAGLIVVGVIGARWVGEGFPTLSRLDHALAIVGMTTSVVGMQTMFSSFLASLLAGNGTRP